ncbi:MAG: NFYB/HAP3 family transcription factor subunit [Candidatus Aenigmarchaeota archaeon]|nr:NFYB/HAP3 family transcription factor subunit [Candidatus Aenigmarchaeota archaeon]MCX8191000.1 NFYB/HAP3 family transcription factor subunit [Candidatus Aenigmarchaeota archaeon]MDW8160271.1 NFYB/HAP3 family transcription factor subunit [Candidatus Aenigmarchaeota archaeon]
MILKRETFDKILKQKGAKRISPKASQFFAEYVEKKILEVLRLAYEFSLHAKRKTVIQEDIILAKKKLGI